jgi:polyhydroxyalkanoate synthesis regulator phasin
MQARAEATDAEVQRIEQAVKKTAEQAVANGQLSAVNQTQIKAVVDSLSQQQETLKATDEKLAQLIQIMLQKQ